MPTPADIYDPVINQAATAWNVDPLLVKAVLLQESSGNWRALSPAGAIGLMGLMPQTAANLGVEKPWDPVQNIFGGAKYLSQALDAEGGNPQAALLYYHGGPGWRRNYGPESASYVPAIAGIYKTLQPAPASDNTSQPEATADAR